MKPDNSSQLNAIDSVFRLLKREAWVVTAAHGPRRGGLIATWVSQASIDRERPVVLVGVAHSHYTADLIDCSEAFALHLLRRDQLDLVWRFSLQSGRTCDKLADLPHHRLATGSPILNDCLAWLECRVFARLATGDRNFYWADVVAAQPATAAGRTTSTVPLTDHDIFAAASESQRQALLAGRDEDVDLQRPLSEAWRKMLPPWLKPFSQSPDGSPCDPRR